MKISMYGAIIVFLIGYSITCYTQGVSMGKQEFSLHSGVNVSHWLSQSDKRGEERRAYITQKDFQHIAALGFDHVRIPVDEEQLWDSTGAKEKEAFDLLHSAIRWAKEAQLRVIVDLHILRSHHFIAEANPLWTDPREQEKLISLWLQLSDELRKYPTTDVAYEILNEAVAPDPELWNSLFNRVVSALRQREPKRFIVIGSNMWQIPGTFPMLRVPENDRCIILSFHFYTPLALTHHTAPWTPIAEYRGPVQYPGMIVDTAEYRNLSPETVEYMREVANGYFDKERLRQEMMPAIEVARKLGLQLYCGEFGVYPKIPEDTMLRWYRDVCELFNEHSIAYCHWCYKGDFPILNDDGSPKKKLVDILIRR